MKKEQLARQLAKQSNISPAAAADQLDRVAHEILMRVRGGQSASLPGLGTFRPDLKAGVRFDIRLPPGGKVAKPKKDSR